ncbi:MAG: hypothetical protein E7265_09095 [Lachnospiraceae bacterium]|nr:hypothetical protein [Lachnospiraceae bacterium]
MNNDTVNLLKECNAGCKSATNSMEQVLGFVKNEKLRQLIERYNDSHIKIGDECHDMLNEMNENEKDPQKAASMMAKIGTEMKLMMDDSTKKVAELLIDGCNMGIKSLCKYINQYTTADEKCLRLTKRLVKLEQDFMNELLAYL